MTYVAFESRTLRYAGPMVLDVQLNTSVNVGKEFNIGNVPDFVWSTVLD